MSWSAQLYLSGILSKNPNHSGADLLDIFQTRQAFLLGVKVILKGANIESLVDLLVSANTNHFCEKYARNPT